MPSDPTPIEEALEAAREQERLDRVMVIPAGWMVALLDAVQAAADLRDALRGEEGFALSFHDDYEAMDDGIQRVEALLSSKGGRG